MKRTALIITILVLGATVVSAETFKPATYLADADVEVLTKSVANQMVGRDLFGVPYATVVVGNVDVYDRFPYLEAHFFQIVSDPGWNRLLLGEIGQGLVAYDGTRSSFGRLATPRGLSSDGLGHVFVADTGNDRVLVFRAVSEFDRVELRPLYSIDGLSKPYDVAYSDGGTPYDAGDDRLYVANTGRNEVRRYQLTDGGARLTDAIGELGSGVDHFAGPMALTVGHREGVHTKDVYVSDAHNSRLVHLQDAGDVLVWTGTVPHEMGPVTSLDTDHWGNVYAAAPQVGSVAKFTSSLFHVASFSGNTKRPRSFHVPFTNVTDHRTGERTRTGQGSGILVEEWGGESGIRMLNLGIEVTDAAPVKDEGAAVRVTLTDHGTVTATITHPGSGRVIARHDAGLLNAGPQTIRFAPEDYISAWDEGEYRVTVRANSTYDTGAMSETEITIVMDNAGGPVLPDRLTLLGNTPNPFNPSTTIRFTVPAGPVRDYRLRVYDVRGRLVRTLAAGQIVGGLHEVLWDGRNESGESVSSGIYLYRLDVGRGNFTGKMVLVK